MTERLETTAQLDIVSAQSAALARNWFEVQAASFRSAQSLIGTLGVDLNALRMAESTIETENESAVYLKAIDAIKVSVRSSRLFREGYDNEISRQKLKNVATELLGRRAMNSVIQADRREAEYFSYLTKTDY